jgi:hypothetical protein
MKIRQLIKTIDQLIIKNEIGQNKITTFFFLEYSNKNLSRQTNKKSFIKKSIKNYLMINTRVKLNLFLNKFKTLQLLLNASDKVKTNLVYSQVNKTSFNNFILLQRFKKSFIIENKFFMLLINKIILKF